MQYLRENSAMLGQSIEREPIKNIDRFLNSTVLTPSLLKNAQDKALAQVKENISYFKDQYPQPSSEGQQYHSIENVEWTSGFWSGQLWLSYQLSGEQAFADAGLAQIRSYRDRIENRIVVDHHDLGFLYSLSCIAAFKTTSDSSAKLTALKAADCLMERFLPVAGIIQAWGNLNDPSEAGRMIMDCNLNLPLLYWASEESGDPKYRDAANQHIRQAVRYLIRDDASSFHTYFMDVKTGNPLKGATHQGYSDSSCWARGQAWGITGFPLVYRYYPAPALLEQSARLANYFLNRLPRDHICYWDLIFTQGEEPRDSSSAAIAVCGLLDLVRYLPLTDPDRAVYEGAAKAILSALIKFYTPEEIKPGQGLLLHGVYHMPNKVGVDEACAWGDYFYLEALTRFAKIWEPYW